MRANSGREENAMDILEVIKAGGVLGHLSQTQYPER